MKNSVWWRPSGDGPDGPHRPAVEAVSGLWEVVGAAGAPDLVRRLAQDRKFEFDLERTIFALALQRLCAPGSDLAASEWVKTVAAPGFEGLARQHFSRTAAFLAGVRQDLEGRLFLRDLNLFNQTLDVVFIDTTSLYGYRGTETEWRRQGYSRDQRPDLPQRVLCVAVNATSWPIAWEIFPGNTAHQKALGQVVALLRKRFPIRRVTVVADRGMISRDTGNADGSSEGALRRCPGLPDAPAEGSE